MASDEMKVTVDAEHEEVAPTHCAVAIRTVSGQRHVGVGFVTPRARTGEADKKCFRLGFYQFLDNDQFSHLESVLVQLQCASCLLTRPKTLTADLKKISNMLDCLHVDVVECAKSAFSTTDIEQDLARLLGDDERLLTEHMSCQIAMGCIAALVSRRHLLADVDTLGGYTLEHCSLDAFAQLDNAAVRALNLLPDPRDPGRLGSVHALLSHGCWTKAGARLLKRWVLQPLVDPVEIRVRQSFVEVLVHGVELRDQLRDCVKLPDVERIISRLQRKSASLSEIVQVVNFAELLPTLIELLRSYEGKHAEMLEVKFTAEFERLHGEFQKLISMAEQVIDMDAARGHGEYKINPSWNDELQELSSQHADIEDQIKDIYEDIMASWGSSLGVKCDRDPRRGVVLRTKRANDKKLRKQMGVTVVAVLKDGVRFTTSRLSQLGKDLLDVSAQYEEQQAELVAKAVEIARTYLPVIEASNAVLAELDAYNGMAMAAVTAPNTYCKPTLSKPGEGDTVIVEARHPVLEVQDDMTFIANDYRLHRDTARFHIITGPNMGGKSTYIRQLGVLAVMAQMGSFLPATSAQVSIVDCVLARVGAGDLQLRGVSTFMAEMLEAATILKTATPSSLVIIDELGRGTSTYDGFGLAWAISEFLASQVKCFCMFATHFHELTALQHSVKGVCNRHVTAHTSDEEISMLYEVKDGSCPSSFGIHVAEMAAFPPEVIKEARRKASQLEKFSTRGRELIMATTVGPSTDPSVRNAKRRRVMGPVSHSAADDEELMSFLRSVAALPLDSMAPAARVAKVEALASGLPAELVGRLSAPSR